MVGDQPQYAPTNSDCLAELEMSIKFPTCWDGVNVEAQGDTKHVVYATECDSQEHNECFDLDCPASHPVKMPELHLFVRVKGYEGGAHMFSDGSDVSHVEYKNYSHKGTITTFKQADERGKKLIPTFVIKTIPEIGWGSKGFSPKPIYNTSLACARGTRSPPHRLINPKWPTGSGNMSNPRFLDQI